MRGHARTRVTAGRLEQERKGDEVGRTSHSKGFGSLRATKHFVRNKDRWDLASVVGEPLRLCGGAGQAKGGKVDAGAIIRLRNDGGWMPWGRRIVDLF